MKKFFFFLLFFFAYHFGAQTFSISGKVQDSENNALENATVSLLKQKDSSVVNFTGTSAAGSFSFKVPKQNEPTFLQISNDKSRVFIKISNH